MRDPTYQLEEARALIKAAYRATDRRRYRTLLAWAKKLLEPLAASDEGEAAWVLASLPKDASLYTSDDEFHRLHHEQARRAARAGSASAMFFLGCELDHTSTIVESTEYFRSAAELSHPYAMWCYGLNLISGRGTEKNVPLGLGYIERAAEAKFEGAIHFLSHALAQGTYGYEKDESKAAEWWAKLKDQGVIRY